MIVHIITRLAMGGAQQIVYEISDRLKSSNRDVLIISGLSDLKSSLSAHDNKILDQVKEEKIPIKIIAVNIAFIALF